MRYRLWAASPQKPRIAFDIRFMELLRVLQLEAHLPAKGFCDALDHLDNDFIHNSEHFPKDIYRAVIGDCLREYLYHSSLLKTRYTYLESTIGRECPICRREPSLISFDANFGLVHKESSGDGHGKTAARHNDFLFVDPSKFKNFIEDYNVDKGSYVNDCSNFQAGSLVRSKSKNAKLDVKGLFGSICKHDIPYLFIDMEYGERLGYAVFIMDKLLEENESKTVLMYDIACMLHKHLMKNKRNDLLDKFSFAVPVFHSFAHNMQCQLKYGQKFMDDCGLTDGEGIERLWSYLRRFKSITKEMSYDNRVDLLTEALIHNSEKIISNMGPRLHSKLCKAEKIIKDSPFKNQEELSQAGTWLQNWKKDTESKNTKGNELNSTEKFVECVHKIKTISTSVGVMHYDANKEALITR
ncbi:uncharacterized protein LOC126821311 [Patella vulgata]|uniref:uncharacterized protein LOC126821311 n=1 Tax=Patella vulgata TaxID=6465 RepID=UPI0024A8F4EB|nr:uncharacterized protein LOC126821311 [Patella vulgata]